MKKEICEKCEKSHKRNDGYSRLECTLTTSPSSPQGVPMNMECRYVKTCPLGNRNGDTKTMYQITVSEEQLRLIADAVEDWSRFLCGQTELWHATSMLENHSELKKKLEDLQKFVVPKLYAKYGLGSSYGWSGAECPNDYQRKAIAMSYGIYREFLHFLAMKNNWQNVYSSSTLTCPEQGGLPIIKEVEVPVEPKKK